MKHNVFIGAGIIVVVASVVFIMILKINKPSSFDIKDGDFIIGGSFGVTVPMTGIADLELSDVPPTIVTRTNGSGVGTIYKGEFTLDGNVKSRLYIDASKPPFIIFNYNGTVFYINLETPEETQTLYEKLLN